MKPKDPKFIVHEGMTDLEHMKLDMFRTVVRQGGRVLIWVFSLIFLLFLVRVVAEFSRHGF